MFSFPGMLECRGIHIKKTGAPDWDSGIIFGLVERLGWVSTYFGEKRVASSMSQKTRGSVNGEGCERRVLIDL